MKKIYILLICFVFSGAAFAQPYTFPVNINPADTGLVSSPARRTWELRNTGSGNPIVVDGVKDDQWDWITPQPFDRFILCRTGYSNGIYACNPDTAGTWSPNRIPDSKEDFSGSFRVMYDEDYLYTIYEVTDNEVNDGVKNAGVSERLELVEAPYMDSVQQKWNGHYPPYSGAANELARKFAYWQYLGAFRWNFTLMANGKCNMSIDERADAMAKINYTQRVSSCQCAWKLKSNGTGYIMEAALSFKIGLSDSANKPFVVPALLNTEIKSMAFDMFIYDYDQGRKQIKASWNAQDDNVWDAMLYTGKLMMISCCPWEPISGWDMDESHKRKDSFYPNPAIDLIRFSRTFSSVQLISMDRTIAMSDKNISEINISHLPEGIYAVIAEGKAIGKLQKL